MKSIATSTVTGVEEIIGDIDELIGIVGGAESKIGYAVTDQIAASAQKNWAATHLEDVNGVPIAKDVGPVTVQKTGEGFSIDVSGEDVAFLEFGAGVHYNPSEPYPIERPAGIVGIGMFGKGKGKKDSWSYGRPKVKTFGNPAFMPMFKAARSGERKIFKIAKEIFK